MKTSSQSKSLSPLFLIFAMVGLVIFQSSAGAVTSLNNVKKVSTYTSGRSYRVAVTNDGKLYLTGWLNSGGVQYSEWTEKMTGVIDATNFYSGARALKSDGTLWEIGSSGNTTQIANGLKSLHGSVSIKTDGSLATEIGSAFIYPINNVVHAWKDTGTNIIMAVKTDGTVWQGTGASSWSQITELGSDNIKAVPNGYSVSSNCGYYGCSATYYYGYLVLKSNGTLWAKGVSRYGHLGNGSTGYASWTQVADNVRDFSSYEEVTYLVKNDNTLWIAGSGSRYKPGNGSSANISSFTQVLTGISAIADSGPFAIATDGYLWGTGYDDINSGSLGFGGIGTQTKWARLLQPFSASDATSTIGIDLSWPAVAQVTQYEVWRGNGASGTKSKIATVTGTNYTDTTASDSLVYGYQIKGVEANAFTLTDLGQRKSTVTPLTGNGPWSKTAMGSNYTLALQTDGNLYASGDNDKGQFGNGTNTTHQNFIQVLSGVKDILAAGKRSFVIKNDNSVWAAGDGLSSTWQQIATNAKSIHDGASVLLVKNDGSLHVFNGSAFTPDSSITNVIYASQAMYRYVVKSDNTLWKYASGSWSQLLSNVVKVIPNYQAYCYYGCFYYDDLLVLTTNNDLLANGGADYSAGTGNSFTSYGSGSFITVFSNVKDVSGIGKGASSSGTYALMNDSTLWFAGAANSNGAAGNGSTSTLTTWTKTFDNVQTLPANAYNSNYAGAIVRTNGSLWLAGQNANYRLGLGDTANKLVWTQFVIGDLKATKGTINSSVDLTWTDFSGESATYEIWRSNGHFGTKNKIATTSLTSYSDATANQGTSSGIVYGYQVKLAGSGATNMDYGYRTPATTAISGAGNFVKTAVGAQFSLALKSDGRLFAAGLNSSGQFGDGSTASSNVFKQVLTNVADIMAGSAVSFALKTDGTLWIAGNGYSATWTQILSGVSSIHTNSFQSSFWAIKGGTAYTGTNASNWTATSYSGIQQITGSFDGSGTGTVYTLSSDGSINTTLSGYTASPIGTGFKKIAAVHTGYCYYGCYYSSGLIGVKNDNTLWAWGDAIFDGTSGAPKGRYWRPIFDSVKDVSIAVNSWGNGRIFAIKTDGSLWSTSNDNASGQNGDGTTGYSSYWKQIFDNVASVSPGFYGTQGHSLAIRSNGTLWTTGYNGFGELGLNNTSNKTSWTQTGFILPSKVTGVNATDGTLYAKVAISWTADPDATQYDIYRSTASGSKGSLLVGNITQTTYEDTSVSGNIHYFYTVVAKNPVGSGPDSDQNEGYGKIPAIITNLTATQGNQNSKVTLSWPSNPDATSYEIWRAETATGPPVKMSTLTAMPASAFEDATVSGVSSYFYTIKTLVGSLTSDPSNQAEGWANGAPTAASASLTASSTAPSAATAPSITDPNTSAGKTELYTLTITSPPATGDLAIVGNKFVYTPPIDGLFSGPLTFEFTAIDKGGSSITGTGSINVVCGSPSISSFTLPLTSIQQATPFDANSTYSLPACSNNGQIKVDVLDSNAVIVVTGIPFMTPNGSGLSHTFSNKGVMMAGSYTVRMTASTDSGSATKTATLTVKAINLPTLTITPGLGVTVGEENVTASLSNPAVVNCPFTNSPTTATTDSTQCYVTFNTLPSGMSVDNSGVLPVMSGVIDTAGSYPITAEVHKFDGISLVKIGEVSKTVVASCVAPAITSLNIPALLPYEVPNYGSTYKAYSCNGTLTGTLTIKKGTTTIETMPLNGLGWGSSATFNRSGTGLTAGNHTAEVSITGSYGTAYKAQSFQVRTAPMPTLSVSPTSAPQGETRVDASLTPSTDTTCPLTTVQAEAEADPKKCYVALSTTLPDMTAGTDADGLPTLAGYPSVVGDYTVQAVVSRWVNGTRYDSDPLTKNVRVTEVVAPTFAFTGKTSLYVGIEKASLIFKQDSGTTCTLYADQTAAQTEAAKGKRACFVTFTGDQSLSKTLSLNQYKLEGALTTIGTQTLGYTVKRQFADGLSSELQTGSLNVTVNDLPPPQVTLKGGYKITDGKYYVPLNQAITRATITAGVPTNAKMKYTVTDSQQSFERGGVMNGGSYWISTPNLGLLEERQVTLRVAWQDYPQVYSEQVITAVGGTESNMKLIIDSPQQIADTEQLTVKVNVGKYTKNGVAYTPETMGNWRIQILAQTNTQTIKTPLTEMKDAVNGEATFQINPAGNLFMKLTAIAELVSTVEGLDTTLTSSTRYVEVVKGSPIEGSISAKTLDGPAPKTFTLNLDMTLDNRVALKEVTWERSANGGATWESQEKSNTIRHNVPMASPGKLKARAKMVNKNTLVESYTTPVEVWAYATLDAQIVGPRHVAPDYPVTLAAQLYREGVATTDTVNEWTIEAPSGKTTQTGATMTVTEEAEGKIYITLKSRPADTREDDPSAWSATRSYVIVATPTRPSIYAKGPRDVETGKTYHYVGTVRPSWGSMESVHNTASEWQLPDGSTVSGETLDWSPTAQDLIDKFPLIFRSWVNGFKETTTRETTVTYFPWEYVWPTWTVSLKQLTVQAPSDLILLVNHDRPDMNRRFEGLAYEWSFPSGVTGRQNEAFPNRAMAQALYAGDYDILVTVRDSRGNQTTLTQHVKAEQAVPYSVILKVGKSNYYDRSPMTVTVRPVIYGGHPLDSVVGQTWKVDGMSVDDFANRSYLVKEILDAGNHTISYTLNSKMGETATVDSPLFLVANKPPTCELVAKPNAYVVYAEATCKDADGKVIGYSWEVNHEPIGSTSYRISFTKTATPQTAHVSITAMDDAKELSTPVSLDVNY